MKSKTAEQSGFSAVELLIGIAIGGFVLAGVYRLWSSNTEEGHRLQSKIDLRNQLALSTKRLNQSITTAGLGLDKVVGLAKADAVGSDTLTLYTNPTEGRTTLVHNYSGSQPYITVANGSIIGEAKFVVLANDGAGEVREIKRRIGSTLILTEAFSRAYPMASTRVLPATRMRYYTDQDSKDLMLVSDHRSPVVVAKKIHNFQVSFRNRTGAVTDTINQIRFVNYSLTGVYPAREGALNSMIFSSTSIPRNIL